MIAEWIMDSCGWHEIWFLGTNRSKTTWFSFMRAEACFVGTWTGPQHDLLCVCRCGSNQEAELCLSPPGRTILHATILSWLKLRRVRQSGIGVQYNSWLRIWEMPAAETLEERKPDTLTLEAGQTPEDGAPCIVMTHRAGIVATVSYIQLFPATLSDWPFYGVKIEWLRIWEPSTARDASPASARTAPNSEQPRQGRKESS